MDPLPIPYRKSSRPPKLPPLSEVPERLIDSEEAAAIIGIHPKTLQRYARRGLIREAMPGILRAAERYYVRVCPVLEGKHCPGVVPVLERLTRRGVLLGLVTGNLTRIGWRKLERAGLRGYFRFGAFGEMAKNRRGWRRSPSAKRAEGNGFRMRRLFR